MKVIGTKNVIKDVEVFPVQGVQFVLYLYLKVNLLEVTWTNLC